MHRHIILTRPAGKNSLLQSLLLETGFQVTELPAIERFPLPLTAREVPDIASYSLVFFVSGYAVQVFFETLAKYGRSWPKGLYAGAVGMATANALLAQGVPPEQIIYPDPKAEYQDSEAFFDELIKKDLQTFTSVLVVRGQAGRQWLAEKLQGLNIPVTFLSVYERKPRLWTVAESEQMSVLCQSNKIICWLLTSKESVDSVFSELKRNGLVQYCLDHHFVVTHPRISERLRDHLNRAMAEYGLPKKTVVINICQPSDASIFEMLTIS